MNHVYPACNCTRQMWQHHSEDCAITIAHRASYPAERVHPIGCVCESCSATYERERRDPRDGTR